MRIHIALRESHANLARADHNEIVALLVGLQSTVVLAEKSKLVAVSDYFRSALNGHFLESKTQCFSFPDEIPETINTFVTWIYTGRKKLPGERTNMKNLACMRLYCFAEEIQCRTLQNDLLNLLYGTMKEHVGPRMSPRFDILVGFIHPEAIKCALRRVPVESNLINLIVWYFVIFGNEKRLKDANLTMKNYPEAFRSAITDVMYSAGGAHAIKKQLPPVENFLYTIRRRA